MTGIAASPRDPMRAFRRVCAALAITLSALGAAYPAGAQNSAANRFKNGFPEDPSFFPVGVWMQSPSLAPAYKSMGVNTVIGLWEGPTEEQLEALAKAEMFAITAQNDVGLNSPNSGVIKAWIHQDEPDNAQKNALGLYLACVPPNEVAKQSKEMRRRDPTRPIFINFGRGVADANWHGRGTCMGDTRYYTRASQGADIVSYDIYPVAGSEEPIKGKLEYVARGVANLQNWAKGARGGVWAIVETTRIGHETDRATPHQIRSEVWQALIQGARGIGYFAHEFSGGFREDGIFRYPDAVDAVKRINGEIASLAPVLNSASAKIQVSFSGDVPISSLARRHDGKVYLFAASVGEHPSEARLKIPGIRRAKAVVLGEDRTVDVVDGVLEDLFAGYDVHLYRIEE